MIYLEHVNGDLLLLLIFLIGYYLERWIMLFKLGQTLERAAEDISIRLGHGIEFVQGRDVQANIDGLQSYIDEYGQYRWVFCVRNAYVFCLATDLSLKKYFSF